MSLDTEKFSSNEQNLYYSRGYPQLYREKIGIFKEFFARKLLNFFIETIYYIKVHTFNILLVNFQ